MRKIIISLASAAISGATVYLLIEYLFERPNKTVNPDEFEEIESDETESSDNTIPITKVEKSAGT